MMLHLRYLVQQLQSSDQLRFPATEKCLEHLKPSRTTAQDINKQIIVCINPISSEQCPAHTTTQDNKP